VTVLITFVLNKTWPWVKLRRSRVASLSGVRVTPLVTSGPHRSWVMTDQGRGFLDHHSNGVYTVQLDTGGVIYRRAGEFKNVSELMA
jgi:hypothetical protein